MSDVKESFFISTPKPSVVTKHPQVGYDMMTYLNATGDQRLYWSHRDPTSKIPELGTEVTVNMNGFGQVIVVGYFSSNEWLGFMGIPLNPPEFYKRNLEADLKNPNVKPWRKAGIACFFGLDIK